MTDREIKQEIRRLKKVKLSCRAGSKERIDLHRQIKELKNKLIEINIVEPKKEKLIDNILKIETEQKIYPKCEDIGINLNKYTIEQLELHLKKLKIKFDK